MRKKALMLAALAATTTLTLSACGGSGMNHEGMSGADSSTTGPTSETNDPFNDADVKFATEMIPHHRQAIEMATLAESRASSSEVKALAEQIKGAQDPEIETMTGWLTAWGKPVPADHSGMDMSDSMPGMMSMNDMSELEAASGSEFDRMFLSMMIEHHEGAITMAKAEQTDGEYAAAVELASNIESAQTAEITTMKGLLN